MSELVDLETKLQSLKQKWVGHIPESPHDPRYWEYRADRCVAIRIMTELKKKENHLGI